MKKTWFFVLIFFVCIAQAYSQNDSDASISRLVEETIIYLNGVVPEEGFRKIDESLFLSEEKGIILRSENGIVISASFEKRFSTIDEALEYSLLIRDYFANYWTFFDLDSTGLNIYLRNGIYALMDDNPYKLWDNSFEIHISFSSIMFE
jgi:hypothetical protein